jgi:hypothetical protein
MRSLATYRWETSVNMTRFNQYYGELQVKRDGEDLVICRRLDDSSRQTSSSPATLIEIPSPTHIELQGIASLLARRLLPGVSLTGIDLTTVEEAVASYDVAVVEKDGKVIIL